MAYKALYRTYRPQKFADVVGQETIVRALQNALASKKITHAYLFSGPRGIGKTTIARIFAKALNCEAGHVNDPCCECSSCKEISEGISPNVIEIDAASNNGVDEIRDIREKSKFLPAGAKYKIYIIDEVHMLSNSAFNALLKILEEPPKHIIFILATTEPHKILPTILSRCQRYDFHSFTANQIVNTLRRVCEWENINITLEALEAISISAEGGMRDAYSILDQAIALTGNDITCDDVDNITGGISNKKIIQLATLIENKDISKALEVINELVDLGKDCNKLVNSLLDFYKDTIVYRSVNENSFKSEKAILNSNEFKEYALSVDVQKLFYYIDILNDLQNKIRFSTTPLIYLNVALIKLINVNQADMDFSKRITFLEEKVSKLNNINVSSVQTSNVNVDMEKINILDEKVNQVISELNHMELPKLIAKVQDFEASSPSLFIKKINELVADINNVIADVQLLKVTKKDVDTEDENLSSVDEKRLIELEKMVKDNKPTINYTEVESLIDKKLENISEKIDDLKLDKKENNVIYISDELEDRLKVLEENTFKLMSGALIPQENPVKRVKNSKGLEHQLALFPDEFINSENFKENKVDFSDLEENENVVDAILSNDENAIITEEVNESNEQVDYSVSEMNDDVDLQKNGDDDSVNTLNTLPIDCNEKADESDSKSASESNEINVDLDNDSICVKNDFELTPCDLNPFDEVKDNILNSNKVNSEKVKKREKVDANADLFALYSNTIKENQEKLKKVESAEIDYSPAEKALNESVASLGAHYVTAHSELVRGERGSSEIYFGPYRSSNDSKGEEKEVNDEAIVQTNGYDVKVLERILNDSRTDEARTDKGRLVNLWKYLPTLAPSDKRAIAETLAEGVMSAVGKNEFVITYSSSAICNQIMSKRFKKEAHKLLYEMLDSEYDYLALPDNVWYEKRKEYVDQYNIGYKFPKLTPFNNPELNVVDEVVEKSDSEKMLEKARSIFGDSLTVIDKKED